MVTAAALVTAVSGCAGRVPDDPDPTGWTVTVYYTAVQKYHSGRPEAVTGCPGIDCAHGSAALGTYPKDFVQAVHDEGTGLTAGGTYLNWSSDVGYWLDTAPRDSSGDPLRPFASAAADPEVLKQHTAFRIADCGRTDDGSTPPADVCTKLRAAHWRIVDEFTPGLGGRKHIDAYIGPETGPGFTDSDWYITLERATLAIG